MAVYCEDGRWRYRKMLRFLDGKQRLGGTTPMEDNTENRAGEDEAAMILWAKSRKRPGLGFKGTPWVVSKPWFEEGGSNQRNHAAPLQLGGSLVAKVIPTLGEYLPTYLGSVVNEDARSTHEGKLNRISTYLEPAVIKEVRLLDYRLDQITTAVIDAFRTWLAKLPNTRIKCRVQIISPKTVNNVLNVLGNVLRFAVENEVIARVPKIKRLPVEHFESDYLTFDEAMSLIEATADGSMWRAMVMVGVRAGLRRGELLALMWSDVDFDNHQICVRRSWVRGQFKSTKSRRWRYIPMGPELRDTLHALRVQQGGMSNQLLFREGDGSPIRLGYAQSQLERLCREAHLRRIGWHVLRHTFASHCIMRGISPRQLQLWLGHSSLLITERYIHLMDSHAKTEILCLESTPRLRRAARTAHGKRERKTSDKMRHEKAVKLQRRDTLPTVWQDAPAGVTMTATTN